jgi:integrase
MAPAKTRFRSLTKRRERKAMAIFQEKDHAGRTCWVVSKYWPDGKRFRRRVGSKSIANNLWHQIEAAVASGTWLELRQQLTEPPPEPVTIAEFAEVYLSDYCKVQNTRPEFKEYNLKPVVRLLGHVNVTDITREHGHYFRKERRKEVGSNATVNRGVAVLRNMLAFAIDKGLIAVNPLNNFKALPEPETVLVFMTLEEERRLVRALIDDDHITGMLCGLLGETGLRLKEGLRIKWSHLNLHKRLLTVDASKNGKIRHLPLSPYALELLSQISRVRASSYVFTRLETLEPMKKPWERLKRVRKTVNLNWVGFHDFRHFRASQWVMRGVDLRTVKEYLGHADIHTTMRYAHFAPNHAHQSVIEAQRQEQAELAAVTEAAGNK